MRLSTLKKDLEPFVGVPVEYFKVFRLSNSGESECSCLTEQLNSYEDGERLNVKLGRALRNGEFKVKLYQLLIDSTEVCIIFSYFAHRKFRMLRYCYQNFLLWIKILLALQIVMRMDCLERYDGRTCKERVTGRNKEKI